jgi:hypothetical protein
MHRFGHHREAMLNRKIGKSSIPKKIDSIKIIAKIVNMDGCLGPGSPAGGVVESAARPRETGLFLDDELY